ncbi:MAG: hypothetical protein ACRDJN_15950, partial [Chloroflexota bacterium]
FEAAKAVAADAVGALPDRLQIAVVGYSRTAYILLAPTHDHGATGPALSRLRTAEEAAAGDAIAVAIATVPLLDEPTGGQPPPGGAPSSPGGAPPPAGGTGPGGAGGGGAPAPKVPAAVVLISSGEVTLGRPLGEALRSAAEAGIPVHTVPIGPRAGTTPKAPFEAGTLRQIAQLTGGRFLSAPTRNDWRELYQQIDSAVIVERTPQEIGHYVGAGALAVTALAMLISLLATRRLV